ncbi:alginate lyase family protein [Paenibacillus solisilvae]|uniref:Alginate lyase family protein n=1 Tax=Paenibacillus solisilvae TaxID=2486751 RepID=A0ABW0W3R9_9BACL
MKKLFVTIPAAIIGACLFATQLTLAPVAFAYPHPGGLYSLNQINLVKANAAANKSPWKSAYDVLIAKAKWLQPEKPSAVATFYVPAYYSDPVGHTAASAILQDDVKAAYLSAVAYALTGTASYGNKAIEILNNWAYTNTAIGADDSSLVMSYAGIGFIQTAELMSTYEGWGNSDKAKFKEWVSGVFINQVATPNKNRTNNWGAWGVFDAISAYRFLDDSTNVLNSISLLQSKIDTQIAQDGSLPEEVSRGAGGLRYTYFYLAPLTAAAQIALESEGIDLFNWISPQGKTIKSALDFLLYYTQNPAKWPYYANPATPTAVEAWPYNLFEAMTDFYPDPAFDALASARRPIMETGHHYAWTFPTLMKSERSLVNETFDGMTVGSAPTGWVITNSQDSSTTVSNVPGAADKALKITDTNITGASLAHKLFAPQTGIVTAQWSFMQQTIFPYAKFGLRSGAVFATEIYTAGSNLAYRDSSRHYVMIQSFTPGTWYTVKIVANPMTDKYDIYVNGLLKVVDAPFANPVSSFNSIAFYGGWEPTGTVYINNVGLLK